MRVRKGKYSYHIHNDLVGGGKSYRTQGAAVAAGKAMIRGSQGWDLTIYRHNRVTGMDHGVIVLTTDNEYNDGRVTTIRDDWGTEKCPKPEVA